MGKTAKAIPSRPSSATSSRLFVSSRSCEQGARRDLRRPAPAPRASTADAARRHASRFRAGAVSSRELTHPPPRLRPHLLPSVADARTPLISEHAMKQMIVLNAGASAPGSAAASRATRGRLSSSDDDRDARSPRAAAVADSSPPRRHLHGLARRT